MLLGHDAAFWIAVASIVAAAGFFQSAVGFGFALLTVPAMSLFIRPQTAVVVVFFVSSLMSLLLVSAHHRHVDWPTARRLSLGAIAAMPIGVVLLVTAPTSALRVLLGVVTCSAAVWLMAVKPHERTPGILRPRTEYLAGAASGVLNTSLSANGPPLVIYLRSRALGADEFRATISVVFSISNVVGIFMLLIGGAIHAEALRICAIGLAPAMAGWGLGFVLGRKLPMAVFTRLVDGLLLVGGVLALVKAFA